MRPGKTARGDALTQLIGDVRLHRTRLRYQEPWPCGLAVGASRGRGGARSWSRPATKARPAGRRIARRRVRSAQVNSRVMRCRLVPNPYRLRTAQRSRTCRAMATDAFIAMNSKDALSQRLKNLPIAHSATAGR
jgi:hypothetical protein